MKITLQNISYEQFRQFYLTVEDVEKEVNRINTHYRTNKNPIMMNDHESKEYSEYQERLAVARRRDYGFSHLKLEQVYVSSFKVTHDNIFQNVDGHVVPVSVNLEIDYWL